MTQKKKKRLPNGFGQISFVKEKNLRNPYRAMVTVSKDDLGKYKRKIIGYFKTYKAAYAALEEYHKITFEDLFNEWYKYNFNRLLYPKAFETAFKELESLHCIKLSKLSENIIDSALSKEVTPTVKGNMKILVDELLSYAKERRYL